MDSRNIFRRFFGFPNRPPSSFGLDEEYPDNPPGHGHDESERFNFFFDDSNKGLEGMFEHFHGDMWRQMESLNRQMEDLFRGFGAVDFPSFDQPNLKSLEPERHGNIDPDEKVVFWSNIPSPFFHQNEKKNLRDYMLKDGADDEFYSSRPALPAPPAIDGRSKFSGMYQFPDMSATDSQKKGDTDLDGKISEDKILEMIKKPTQSPPSVVDQHQQPHVIQYPKHFSSRSSVSVMTIKGTDNKVEHKRTVKDWSGNEETTVTRSMGGRSHTVTMVTGKDGTKQRHEKFNNMDENDVSKFEEEWAKNKKTRQSIQSPDSMLPAVDVQDKNLYSKLFGLKNH